MVLSFPAASSAITDCAVSADGKMFVTCSRDSTVKV